jgi:DNA helicase II / ATP-dependent DNA helicase PcrA
MDRMTNFLEGLNKVQRDAVEKTEGPSLVIAGAGSGKTRVLTFRIANLLSKGIPPSRILALTFTNKAAREMKERIARIVSPELTERLWTGTFHSIFSRILRYEAEVLNYSSGYTIYDTVDSKSVIRKVIKDLNLDDQTYKPNDVLGRISSAKNNLITVDAYRANTGIMSADRNKNRGMMADIYRTYVARCRKADAMDFDDLLLNTNILFRDHPEILKKYQEKFDYVLVDEYQDTNFAQYVIVKKLTSNHNNICVVGDDAQSIYSFRGAKIENILNFRNDYPEYNIYKLEQNYRSTKMIVDAANSIIAKNRDQIQKVVFSKNEDGEKIRIIRTLSDNEEGFIVAGSIVDEKNICRLKFNDFAILYRTNAQSRIFEESLRKKNIPYKIYGAISFYQRKEIKDLLGYYRLIINNKDDEAIKRVINYPARGIGQTTLDKLEAASNLKNCSIWEIINELDEYNPGLNKGTLAKITSFKGLIDEYTALLPTTDAYKIAHDLASKSGVLKDLYNGDGVEERMRYENVEELLNGIKEFSDSNQMDGQVVTLDRFMENVALLTDADNDKDEERDKVSLMTIHAAKGLEFNQVYIVGVEEDLFPSKMAMQTPKEIEEERRLFYVALTRAKMKVTISYSESRYKWGVPSHCRPSRFIAEIDPAYIDMAPEMAARDASYQASSTTNYKSKLNNQSNARQIPEHVRKNMLKISKAGQVNATPSSDFEPDDPALIQAGMDVEHQRFGIGKVIQVEGSGSQRKAIVFFGQNQEEKKLLLKFAKLKIHKTV